MSGPLSPAAFGLPFRREAGARHRMGIVPRHRDELGRLAFFVGIPLLSVPVVVDQMESAARGSSR